MPNGIRLTGAAEFSRLFNLFPEHEQEIMISVTVMTTIEHEILDALLELEQAASGMASSETKPDLRPIFTRLDKLAAQLPADAPADLRHYLQRKSYQKARAFLQER
jgi:hypothetical protein